ncbi:MAG: ROK family protein [Victivallales bacterium]|nr:ROK family protein [Victivallales bacterium]
MAKCSIIENDLLRELFRCDRLRRRDFVAATGYRPASVFAAVNNLKRDGRLIEPDRQSARTGRNSPELRLNPAYGHYLGLEVQPRRVLGMVIDNAGQAVARAAIAPESGITAAAAAAAISRMIEELRPVPADMAAFRGVGFADPGMVDMKKQVSLHAVNVPSWKNLDAAALIRSILPAENILVLPETMARAYAEYQARLPQAPEGLFQISLNSGIGGGLVKNGELFVGDTGRAMEIGHLVVVPDGPQCQCGNRGCLEAVAGEIGIRRRIEQMAADGVRTELRPDGFCLAALVAAVRHRDRAAMLLAAEICDYIADALTAVVTLLNPSMIVISGELSGLGHVLLDAVKKTLAFRCFPGATERLQVEFSRLDEYAACYAVALMVRNRVLLGE